mmetsp:Transcript_35465/g.59212  ORF Transcript_35465/g.59212 Transcript_35465/m.59212 type:complete len:237 (-) Transcript_35465:293-1003(-)
MAGFERRREIWEREQLELAKKVVLSDVFDWRVTGVHGDVETTLQRVAGFDISFVEGSEEDACASMVVCSFPEMKVLCAIVHMIKLDMPYIPGFLGFRECPAFQKLYEDLKDARPDLLPQLLLIDGNGVLHSRGCGQASHLGILLDLPSIGAAKTFFHVDGMSTDSIRKRIKEQPLAPSTWLPLVGQSGRTWGAALVGAEGSTNPIFVSPGHKGLCHRTLYKFRPIPRLQLGLLEFR